ncbi:MAG: ATP-binding protein, partial [Verrucomicrobia bacterium]|nr:ATP-binding protein [Verrucomicrobiota bacterium]
MQPPNYFNEIQRRASARWDQLECDPELAGPWHQLFGQVTQSPRYVVSELLQNADDAGAKSASVRIEDNTFIFEHDGDDFDAEQFASLCRFGFSNKRTLHTIGFRGVGFKSTFSLGNAVEVQTPRLAVCFKKKRFTDPIWLSEAKPTRGTTIIRVRITDKNRASALRKNFQEWTKSPASLLFFNNLKELSIEEQVITRQPLGKGPAADSSWVKLIGADAQKVLVVHSEALPFPDEASEEIYAERGVSAEDLQLPPCRV